MEVSAPGKFVTVLYVLNEIYARLGRRTHVTNFKRCPRRDDAGRRVGNLDRRPNNYCGTGIMHIACNGGTGILRINQSGDSGAAFYNWAEENAPSAILKFY